MNKFIKMYEAGMLTEHGLRGELIEAAANEDPGKLAVGLTQQQIAAIEQDVNRDLDKLVHVQMGSFTQDYDPNVSKNRYNKGALAWRRYFNSLFWCE